MTYQIGPLADTSYFGLLGTKYWLLATLARENRSDC